MGEISREVVYTVRSNADHLRCNSSIVVTRWTASPFAYCFHLVMLALWSSSLVAAHFALCFISVCNGVLFGAASEDQGEISHE